VQYSLLLVAHTHTHTHSFIAVPSLLLQYLQDLVFNYPRFPTVPLCFRGAVFALIDETGSFVWWVLRAAFELPRQTMVDDAYLR